MMLKYGLMTLAVAILSLAGTTFADELQVGDAAPEFEMKGSDGKVHKLSDYKGKQVVVLAWFPKAFTGGCTKECKSFRDNGEAIRKYNVAYFTASVDAPEDNKRFAESLELDYPILSDPDMSAAKAYGVVNEKRKLPFRYTYVIGLDGKILKIDRNVNAEAHGEDLVKMLEELNVEKKG